MFDNHIIPPNVSDTGNMLGAGRYRKITEAVILAGTAIMANCILLKGSDASVRVAVLVITMIPALIALAGIGGRPLTEFLADYIAFRLRQGVFPYRLPMPMEYIENRQSGIKGRRSGKNGSK